MPLSVTSHSENCTIDRDEAADEGAPSSTSHIVYWLSTDGQSHMVMGWGDSEAAAIADAQRECDGLAVIDGELTAMEII